MENPHKQLTKALDILERLARHGLIHCDLNEFNLMVHHDGAVTVIDFPQMISTNHPNAEQYFDRDVQGICKFFYMKMKIAVPAAECPTFKKVLQLLVTLTQLQPSQRHQVWRGRQRVVVEKSLLLLQRQTLQVRVRRAAAITRPTMIKQLLRHPLEGRKVPLQEEMQPQQSQEKK